MAIGEFTEADVLLNVPRWRWLSLKVGGYQIFGFNIIVSLIASAILWGFTIASATDPLGVKKTFKDEGQPWITQNFSWLYIITQDVWCIFLIYITCSRFGKIKLGKEGDKPAYNDLSWFCMLFCCGVAVGFFFFGVGEPLYYYRQPTYWKGWAYDYNLNKIQVGDDDQRANQSIFMCFFHWGIHGWIPYVLLAVNAGIVSHRWGLPMTIRACFYPLIGDHIYGFIGDIIDGLSMACTTFGVCTSLGLGTMQLAAGLSYMQREFATPGEKLCTHTSAAGVSTSYRCDVFETVIDPANGPIVVGEGLYVGIIWGITAISTISVITGLKAGLKHLSHLAMLLTLTIFFFVLVSDNTFYLINVFVQNLGLYFQYIIQVGFDCEAFQQLAFEFDTTKSNLVWGSGPLELSKTLADAGVPIGLTGSDCGSQVNPCTMGMLNLNMVVANAGSSLSAASLAAGMAILGANAGATMVPCGTGYSTTAYDAPLAAAIGGAAAAAKSATGAPLDFVGTPQCPSTTFDETYTWGQCNKYAYACSEFQAKFDSTNRMFMDWWTIFYWGWWVSWGPFVGIFMATISRGRTIRQLVVGGFVMPCLFSFAWFSVFGGLAIKMERVAEMALNVKPDWKHGTVNCDEHYDSSGVPISLAAIKLSSTGYTMITCRPFVTQIYDVVRPYQGYAPFLMVLLWVSLFFFFITSSDSGSYVDDLLSSSGMSHPPAIQKIYWCVTEGAVASILVGNAGSVGITNILKSLRSVSICAGLPLTILLCLSVPATNRALKREAGDADIINSKKFNTQLFDFAIGFMRKGPSGIESIISLVINLFLPSFGIYKGLVAANPTSKCSNLTMSLIAQLLWVFWFGLQIGEVGTKYSASLSWTAFFFMAGIVGYTRTAVRMHYNIWGSMVEDIFLGLTMTPFVCSQLQFHAANDGEGAPAYFADLDAFQVKKAAQGDNGDIPAKAVEAIAVEVSVA